MLSPVPGAAEQDPDRFVQTCFGVLAECASAVQARGHPIAAIGLSGIIGSLVVLDRDCQPLGMAFTWADLRCGPQVGEALQRQIVAATAEALQRWEPRLRVTRVAVAPAAQQGHVSIDLDGEHLLAQTPVSITGLVV